MPTWLPRDIYLGYAPGQNCLAGIWQIMGEMAKPILPPSVLVGKIDRQCLPLQKLEGAFSPYSYSPVDYSIISASTSYTVTKEIASTYVTTLWPIEAEF